MKKELQNIRIADYTYDLPADKIAKFPLPKRDESRLLVYQNETLYNRPFYDLPRLLPGNSTLILNDTRVIEARILFQKQTGGVIEIFCLEPYLQSVEESLQQKEKVQWQCLIGGASKWKHGQLLTKKINLGNQDITLSAHYLGKESESFVIEFSWPGSFSFAEIIHVAGNIPLPPYIKRNVTEEDRERYQTVFSKHEGSVAA